MTKTRRRSVPLVEGVPVWAASDPLLLSDRMRLRLRTAVELLLADPALYGAPDSVLLAVVVAAAKTNRSTMTASLSATEFGRWLGLQATTIRHEVRPRLQQGVVLSEDVEAEPAPGAERGRTAGICWTVEALRRARFEGGQDDPLRLERSELATLLRLCEALFGPGWRHRDGSETPAGLLAWRTGHGAATDRLALLLAVLHGRTDGSVRLCGGAVDERGRPAATLGRLLGRGSAAGEQALNRLRSCEVMAVVPGVRERLVVPAVAEARHRMRKAARAAGRAPAQPGGGAREAPVMGGGSAWGDQICLPGASSLVSPYKSADPRAGAFASLHADHTPVAKAVEESAGDLCCSGVAEGVAGERCREDACAREDRVPADDADDRPTAVGGKAGPLRGEQPIHPLPQQRKQSGVAAWRKARARQIPPDAVAVLGGLAWPLWDRLKRGGAQARVLRGVRQELTAIAGVVGQELAQTVLTQRLEGRLVAAGGADEVTDPVGWLLARGLPRRGECPDVRCDEGLLMDTGTPCAACEVRIGDRRAVRQQLAAQVTAEQPATGPEDRRVILEQRLRAHTALQAETAARHHEQARAQVAARQAAVAKRREQALADAATAEQQRQAQPCADCRAPQSAGLCDDCGEQRRTEQLIAETTAVAVAVWADLDDPADRAAVASHAETQLRDRVSRAVNEARTDGVTLMLPQAARWEAERAAAEYRRDALAKLARSSAADAEARMAAGACLRGRHPSLAAARAAADQAGAEARDRAAQTLLRDRLAKLRALQSDARAGVHEPCEEDLCADGCGRIALLSVPRCRRCHIAAVTAADRAAARSRAV
ncbi:hypothetical protein IF129_25250 [Streptomyces chumphonensis]|uniref:Uncharacterized protein n=1 Tax=Streptomyces chumphonensis TaxID=1214925 RepID=A0A927F449_9ACTN|nr:hypothetical protein [Streptomyces chumphonensis]MBD3934856.1 hypothetical protein [Streptomyces chumphonensis]